MPAGEVISTLLTSTGRVCISVFNHITPFAGPDRGQRFGPDRIRRVAVSGASVVCISEQGVAFAWCATVPEDGSPIADMDAVGMDTVGQGPGVAFVLGRGEGVRFVDVGMGCQHCILLAVTKLTSAKIVQIIIVQLINKATFETRPNDIHQGYSKDKT